MPDEERRGLLERMRDLSARLDRRRSAWSYLVFSVLFMAAALLWTRLPTARPWVRQTWVTLLLVLAVRDFAIGLRRTSRDRGFPEWTWKAAATVYGIIGAAVALLLAWLRR